MNQLTVEALSFLPDLSTFVQKEKKTIRCKKGGSAWFFVKPGALTKKKDFFSPAQTNKI